MTQDRDDILDALRAALDVAPSPEFRARVRGAIETDAAGRSWRPWVVATVGPVLVVGAVLSAWPHWSPNSRNEDAPPVTMTAVAVAGGAAGEGAPVPPVKTVEGRERSRVPRTRVAGPVTPHRPVEPDVLVRPGQLQLLLAYAAARPVSDEAGAADHVEAPGVEVPEPLRFDPVVIDVVAAPTVDVIKG